MNESANPDNAGFDFTVLSEQLMNDESMIKEIITVFLEDTPNEIKSIRNAISLKDAEKVRNAAHSIKGAAGSIGASSLQELARQLESAGKNSDIELAGSIFSQFEQEFDKLRIILEKKINE
jgi:two-component system sensor histidine kinase/response regulator